MKKIVTSESVNIGHPDKTCDYISDCFLDEALKQDKYSQMAVECAIKNNKLFIYGEATTKAKLDYDKIALKALREIGYKEDFEIIKEISEQSAEINKAVVKDKLCANDQGLVFGYATNETPEFMPLPIMLAHKLMKNYDEFRKSDKVFFFDAKSQVSVLYEDDKPKYFTNILISVSHSEDISNEEICKRILENVVLKTLAEYDKYFNDKTKIMINPSGRFTIYGSYGDSGCVGRKIVVDSYGGVAHVGGGCFSSKNATKVDRSGAYYARYVAKNIVANKLAERCEVEADYAIGLENALNINIECFGTNKLPMEKIYEIVKKNFDFSLQNIISELDLLKPIYKNTACFGHFGREEFSWEKIKVLKKQLVRQKKLRAKN